jgi:hypothetical protein
MDMLMQPTSGKRNNFLVSLEVGNLIEHHICRDSAGARSEVKLSLRRIAQPVVMMHKIRVRMVVTTTSEVCDRQSGQLRVLHVMFPRVAHCCLCSNPSKVQEARLHQYLPSKSHQSQPSL